MKAAIKDEYVRSWPEFRTAAIAWLEKKIDGRTIRDLLLEAHAKKLNDLPDNVWKALPNEWQVEFYSLYDDCAYPVPFTWLFEKGFIQERPRKPLGATSISVRPGVSLKIYFEELHQKFSMSRIVDIHPMNKHRSELIIDREKKAPTPRNDKVFPKYNSAGAWHDAVNAANLFVETMKKNFHFEDWELL